MFDKNVNPISMTELFDVIHTLQREKEILLDTIKHQNRQIEEFEELKEEFVSSEQEKENLQHAMFVVLYHIKQQENKNMDKDKLVEIINLFGTIAMKSLFSNSIKDQFENEVLKGSIIAQQLSEEYLNSFKFK